MARNHRNYKWCSPVFCTIVRFHIIHILFIICSRLLEELWGSCFMFMAHGFSLLDWSAFRPTRFFHLKVFDWFRSYFGGHDYVALGIYDSMLYIASCRINKELIQGLNWFLFDISFHPQCGITNKCRQHSDKCSW